VKSFLILINNAYEIWNELCERLTQQIGPQNFQLKKALANLNQGNDLANIYYTRMLLWTDKGLGCLLSIRFCNSVSNGFEWNILQHTRSNLLMDPIQWVSKFSPSFNNIRCCLAHLLLNQWLFSPEMHPQVSGHLADLIALIIRFRGISWRTVSRQEMKNLSLVVIVIWVVI